MKINRFEDLGCLKEARSLVKSVYLLLQKDKLSKDYRLRDQFIGADISVMNNIAEGFDSQLNNEFIRFLRISCRSTAELESCLYVSLDQDYISQIEFDEVFKQAEKVKQLTDGLLRYLRQYKQTQQDQRS